MISRCPICSRPREVELEFCSLHLAAIRNLEERFEGSRLALGENLSKNEYFETLRNLAETGDAVKRVIDHLQTRN